ncbi:MAG: amidohydrolase family protein [Verrucomicrobiota bacterium]
MKIDSHHHFWRYDPVEYGWIDDAMRVIRRDFLPEDLRAEIARAGIEGVVSVQARQSLAETRWLLELADGNDFIKGVVGWVDLSSPKVVEDLERFAANPKFKSVRHVIQGEPDDSFIMRGDFNRGIRELKQFSLAYDILILERHLPQTIRFVDAHPDQVFVVDHIAKPCIRDGSFEPWNTNIRELARRPNVFCKVSGMVTEADYDSWTEALLKPYFDTVLEAFGPARLMFGSDWPVCLLACDYARWHKLVSGWVADLSLPEQARVLGGTATEAYRL